MVNKLKYTKGSSYTTTIKPKPPFYLFVPSIHEIPPEVRKKHRNEAFVLGEFVKNDEQAWKVLKKAGYGKRQAMILMEQGYLVPRSKMKKLSKVM